MVASKETTRKATQKKLYTSCMYSTSYAGYPTFCGCSKKLLENLKWGFSTSVERFILEGKVPS